MGGGVSPPFAGALSALLGVDQVVTQGAISNFELLPNLQSLFLTISLIHSSESDASILAAR